MTTALAGLVLPSVFRPDADGVLQLDRTVATSAEVTAQDPFTVTYELNLEASWTSNAPIAAEDFVYLWERMRDEPGVVDAAGYRLITDVRSRAAGKAVDVVFSQRLPRLADAVLRTCCRRTCSRTRPARGPARWPTALPASGGPFRVVSVDRARGEVLLTRNDQYWDTPAVLDQLSLRRLGGTRWLTAWASATSTSPCPLPTTPSAPRWAGCSPRRGSRPHRSPSSPSSGCAPTAARSPTPASGRPSRASSTATPCAPRRPPTRWRPTRSRIAPSQPGYAGTAPAHPPRRGRALLAAAGWTRGDDGRWQDGGEPVRLLVGAAAERPADIAVAENVAAQLDAAGIDTTVVAPTGVALFGQATVPPIPPPTTSAPTTAPTTVTATATPTPGPTAASTATTTTATPTPAPAAGVSVDLMVRPRTVGGDPGTELASDYGCDDPVTPSGPPARPSVPTTCSSALQPLLDELLADPDGSNAGQTRAAVEKLLWSQVPALPLFQPVSLLVSTSGADAGTDVGPGPLTTGPLTGAQRWTEPLR